MISLAKLLDMANVPSNLRDEVREMVVIGLGKTEFSREEAKSLVRAIREHLTKRRRTSDGKRNKATASVAFKRNHKPTDYNHCPICRRAMTTAFLRDGREAKYCPHHRVVLPVPVE